MTDIDITRMSPVHPGEALADTIEGLEETFGRKITRSEVAQALGVHRDTLQKLLAGRRSVTPEMAIRLGKVFGQSPQFWLRLQSAYEAALASRRQDDPEFSDLKRLSA